MIMERFKEILIKAGVDKACKEIGIDFYDIFLSNIGDKKINPYKEYEWMVLDYPGTGSVINAVPPKDKTETLPWEEWWKKDQVDDNRFNKGELHHLVVFTKNKRICKNKTIIPENDTVHPPSTAGKTWYWHDDSSLIPYLFWKSK